MAQGPEGAAAKEEQRDGRKFRPYEKKEAQAASSGQGKRLRIDGKATGKIGEFSRGGLTRGDNRARDHDMGGKETYGPCGIVDETRGALALTFGSSYTTSDFMAEVIADKWEAMDEHEQASTSQIQIKMDNGPERRGRRTQFLHRMGQFADAIQQPIRLLYDPPSHSTYHPIERCWGI